MKKIMCLVIPLLLFLMPINAFAATVDVLSGIKPYIGEPTSPGQMATSLDVAPRQSIFYTLQNVEDIKQIKIMINSLSPYYSVSALDPQKKVITSMNGNTIGEKSLSSSNNVKYIVIKNLNYGGENLRIQYVRAISEIEMVYDEIKELNAYYDLQANAVNINWDVPNENEYYMGSKLYKNNQLIASLDKNDTSFIDHEIVSNTDYTFKVTAYYSDGHETSGIEQTLSIPKLPPPKIDGAEYDHNEDGDLIVRWDEPTKGQIKVVVGGKDYATVPASQKQMVIPNKDVVKDAMGNEDVKLIPIGEDGQTGDTVKKPTEIDKVQMPFGANDLLSTAGGLLLLVGGFLLLALSFLVVPKLRKSIAEGLKNGPGTRASRTYREGNESREQRISTKEDRPQRIPKEREARDRHEYRASPRDD